MILVMIWTVSQIIVSPFIMSSIRIPPFIVFIIAYSRLYVNAFSKQIKIFSASEIPALFYWAVMKWNSAKTACGTIKQSAARCSAFCRGALKTKRRNQNRVQAAKAFTGIDGIATRREQERQSPVPFSMPR